MDKDKVANVKGKAKSTEELIKEELKKDPNSAKIQKPGFFQRKARKIKKIFGEFWVLGKSGAMMGGLVGGIMGFIGGCVQAYSSKSLIFIPISMLASGFFFASLMAVGSCLRTEDGKLYVMQEYAWIDKSGQIHFFQMKHSIKEINLKILDTTANTHI